MRPLVGTKSLVELHRLAVCRLFGVDTNDVRIEELGVLVLPCPISEIKLLNCTDEWKTNVGSMSRMTTQNLSAGEYTMLWP